MLVDLPWPNKLLWPNGSRGNHRAVAGQKKRHRQWAHLATLEAQGGQEAFAPRKIVLHVHAKPRGPLPDKDNCIAAYKAFQDGIADALALDDATFPLPTVEFSADRDGRFVVELCP